MNRRKFIAGVSAVALFPGVMIDSDSDRIPGAFAMTSMILSCYSLLGPSVACHHRVDD